MVNSRMNSLGFFNTKRQISWVKSSSNFRKFCAVNEKLKIGRLQKFAEITDAYVLL